MNNVKENNITKEIVDKNESIFTDKRASDILRMRLRGLTFKEIAKRFGFCKERGRQIEAKAVEQLRNI